MYDEYDRTFKEDVAADNHDVFINLTEFAEYRWIDGVLIPCQIVEWTADKSNRQNETYGGLHGDFTTFYFEAACYTRKRERLPRHGEWIYVDGLRYDVVSVKNLMGIAKIVCSAYRQNTLRQQPFDGSVDPYGVPNF